MMSQRAKLVILISNTGIGTNLQAIIDGINDGKINAEICAVVSDRNDAMGLEHARNHNLRIEICSDKKDLLKLLKTSRHNPVILS